jgi:hypothetical protein
MNVFLTSAMNFMMNGFKKSNTKPTQLYDNKAKVLNETNGLFSAIKKAKTL